MPVFNLELKFDDKGALQAVNKIDQVTDATNDATEATDNLCRKGTKNLEELSNSASDAAKAINNFRKETEQASRNVGSISVSAQNASKVVDQLGKSVQDAIDRLSNITPVTNSANTSTSQLGSEAKDASKNLSDMGDKGSSAADAIASKMKSLVKDVIALAAAYGSVKSAMAFMNRGLEFNSNLEQSQIGVASLLTSMVKIQDEQGKILENEDKYNAAQGMAAELMQKIQKLGLETTADSQSIVEGFQAILAPALQAGMALQDIPEFAVRGAQALQTMGLPLNQMKFELEALLSGNINLAQDVLAPRLFADVKGDVKDYIKELKASGKLIDEIKKRMEPFKLASQDVAQTWSALTSNLSEAMDVFAGQSATSLTKSLKESVNQLNELFVSQGGDELGIGRDFKNIANILTDIEGKIGGALLTATEKVVEYAKEFNEYLGSNEAVQHLDYLTMAVKGLGAALTGFAAARGVAFGIEKWKALTSAVADYKNGLVSVAKQELEAAKGSLARYRQALETEKAQQAAQRSAVVRERQIARETALINQEAAAQQRLNAAMSMGTGRSALGTGLKGLVSTLGGPLNIAITGFIAAISLLTIGQNDAASATERHAAAQDTYQRVIQGSIDETGKLVKVLNEAELAEARAAERQLSRDWTSSVREMTKGIEAAEKAIDQELATIENANNEMQMIGESRRISTDDLEIKKEAIENIKKYFNEFKSGKITFDELKAKFDEVQRTVNNFDKGGQVTNLSDKIVGNADFTRLNGELNETRDVLRKNEEASKSTAKAVMDMADQYAGAAEALDAYNQANSTSVESEKDAVEWLEKRYNATEEGKKALEENARAKDANAIATLELEAAEMQLAATAAWAASMVAGATDAQIKFATDLQNKANELNGLVDKYKSAQGKFGKSGSSGRAKSGGSGMSAENAAKKWVDLSNQLDQLEGKATSSSASLDKTLKSIEETGNAAKKSAQEINEMKKAFIAASDKKALQELNKEILQLEGNTKELQNIERQDKTDQLRAKINDIRSLSEDEKNILLNRVDTAVQNEFRVKDMQTAVDFMKELESLGGDYGESLEMQNQLIEYQATLYSDNLPSAMQPYIEQWEHLKKLGNDKSFLGGLERGVRKFGADYGDVANQVEQFTTQMGSHISNTLADAFMKGKFSAQDFFSSLISMAAQAASNAFIGQIFSGLGNAVGGLFSSGTPKSGFSGTSANYSDIGPMIPNGVYHKGGMVGYSKDFRFTPLSAFFDAPKFHSGGGFFNYGEYPAILKSGERVLNPAETKAYNAGQSSISGWNATPIVNVNVVNESGNPVNAQSQATPNGSGGFDLDIIISQVEQGIVSRAKQGKSQLMQYQQAAYGMDRAPVIARGRGRS